MWMNIPPGIMDACWIFADFRFTLAESGTWAEYIIHAHGNGMFALPPSHKNYTDYLYWFHLANSNLPPLVEMMKQFSFSCIENAGAYTAGLLERLGMGSRL
ncbi:hypothetical protein B0H17DRAFT_1195215 [Mycena rosella]|uniref:Uncharacterized protein n=1 Tax=Mycena rosella TaxID=1033263 RepID=A0AAD7GM18_MYCRO|nr:hypothetical protein B0H17DRAFT_1195215 [Mycena rosella]